MAKLTFLTAFLIMALASASATHTTVVTTTVTDEESSINPRGESCQMEMKQMRMTHCMEYMQSGMRYEPSFLRSSIAVANPEMMEEHLEECCNDLKKITPTCRGDAIRQLMGKMKQMYGMEMEEEKWEMVKEKAHSLPRKCSSMWTPIAF